MNEENNELASTFRLQSFEVGSHTDVITLALHRWEPDQAGRMQIVPGVCHRLLPTHAQELLQSLQQALLDMNKPGGSPTVVH